MQVVVLTNFAFPFNPFTLSGLFYNFFDQSDFQ